ncbi:hypothetical protein D3C80_1569900 [compost metagenome]
MAPADQKAGTFNADFMGIKGCRVQIFWNATDDEVQPRSKQIACQHVAGFHLHVDFNAGIGFHSATDRRHHHADGRCSDRANEHRAATAGLHLCKLASRLAQFQKYLARAQCKSLSKLRQDDAPGGALTERAFDD